MGSSGLAVTSPAAGFELLRNAALQALLLGHELGIAPEQNVSSAAGHVGRDGDRALAARLGYNFGFFLVKLGVQHYVADALLLEQIR